MSRLRSRIDVAGEADGVGLVVDRELRREPEAVASRRRIRTHAAWKVDTHIFSATGPTSAPTRSFISSAALLVNVMARISNGADAMVADEVGDAVREDPGLARPGARHDQQRSLGVGDGVALDGVEPLEERIVGRHGWTRLPAPV